VLSYPAFLYYGRKSKAGVNQCSIDKSSSAELSEAINSMYMWYKNSDVCYAYLPDVQAPSEPEYSLKNELPALTKAFKSSRWFTRGWTLQELIAPRTVEFYTAGWEEIGTKQSLGKEIAEITGIDVRVLRGRDPSEYHVAERMSWAASRTTTRIEDMSYCLLGVFKIHMPLLYGEGNRAFIRLQEEILRTTYDYTILARGFHQSLEGLGSVWTQSIPLTQNYPLATDISPFSVVDRSEEGRYHNLIKDNDTSASTENKQQTVTGGSAQFPLLLTAKGLYITLPMRKVSPTLSLAYLHCKLRQPDKTDKIICMALTELSPGRYQRSGTGPAFQQHYQFMPEHALSSFEISTFYIKQEYTSTQPRSKTLGPGIPKMRIEVEAPIECKMFDSEALSKGEMVCPLENIHPIPRVHYPEILCVLGKDGENDSFLVKVGHTGDWPSDGHWWCHCFTAPEVQAWETWGSHLGPTGLEASSVSHRWTYFPGFVPESPTDRIRKALRTGFGTVSVSIREYPPVPDRNMERTVVVKIRVIQQRQISPQS